jgi:hypothetical protein
VNPATPITEHSTPTSLERLSLKRAAPLSLREPRRIRVRRSWRATSNGAKSIISKQQCYSPIYAVSADSLIVELLNAFFDLVVPGVVAGGGDVLKYIGDAVIAVFPVAGNDTATPACELALAAAQTALAA